MSKENIVSDPKDRILDALEGSTRVTTEIIGHVKGMQREFQTLRESNKSEFSHLRETFNTRVGSLEGEMKTTNSHLDNLVRATDVTNQLLREDSVDRKEQQKIHRERGREDLVWRRKVEERQLDRTVEVEDADRAEVRLKLKTKTAMFKEVSSEFWGVTKQPFGYLIAGIIFWVLIRYFAVPPTTMTPTAVPSTVVEQESP